MSKTAELVSWVVLAAVALCAPPALKGVADQAPPTPAPASALESAIKPTTDLRCPQSQEDTDLSRVHITKETGLPDGYVPRNLVDIEDIASSTGAICVTAPTAAALDRMFAAAREDGIDLQVFSGYRTPDDQGVIMRKWRAIEGALADRAVAPPGHSEHQTGTAVDLTGASVGFAQAQNGFEKTPEYAWLTQNAWKYGFNLSYPKTLKGGEPGEYRFEPWHWRYVGQETAAFLNANGISYDEVGDETASVLSATSTAAAQERNVQ